MHFFSVFILSIIIFKSQVVRSSVLLLCKSTLFFPYFSFSYPLALFTALSLVFAKHFYIWMSITDSKCFVSFVLFLTGSEVCSGNKKWRWHWSACNVVEKQHLLQSWLPVISRKIKSQPLGLTCVRYIWQALNNFAFAWPIRKRSDYFTVYELTWKTESDPYILP